MQSRLLKVKLIQGKRNNTFSERVLRAASICRHLKLTSITLALSRFMVLTCLQSLYDSTVV